MSKRSRTGRVHREVAKLGNKPTPRIGVVSAEGRDPVDALTSGFGWRSLSRVSPHEQNIALLPDEEALFREANHVIGGISGRLDVGTSHQAPKRASEQLYFKYHDAAYRLTSKNSTAFGSKAHDFVRKLLVNRA